MSTSSGKPDPPRKPRLGAADKPKRGPGRPPKKQPAPALQRIGIVESPADPQNRLEFVYEDPTVLKSLFSYFKNLKAVDIHLRCSPTAICFFTRDAAKTCKVVAELPGESMNHYYCDNTFWLGLNRDTVEHIFSSIDKSFFKITLSLRHDNPESLSVKLKDADIDKECHYRVTVSTLDRDDDLFAAEAATSLTALEESPIEFQLTAKQFKKTVADASYYNDTITFEKLGTHPFQLTYARVGIMYSEVYLSPEKIHFRSGIKDTDLFRCTVTIANIKSLANAMVTDSVRVFCRKDNDILFRSEIDALIVNTLTSIVDYTLMHQPRGSTRPRRN